MQCARVVINHKLVLLQYSTCTLHSLSCHYRYWFTCIIRPQTDTARERATFRRFLQCSKGSFFCGRSLWVYSILQ